MFLTLTDFSACNLHEHLSEIGGLHDEHNEDVSGNSQYAEKPVQIGVDIESDGRYHDGQSEEFIFKLAVEHGGNHAEQEQVPRDYPQQLSLSVQSHSVR